jgi:hypothetical protein
MGEYLESKQEEQSRWHLFVWVDEALKEVFIYFFYTVIFLILAVLYVAE